MMSNRKLRKVALLSLHTSPLDQPGSGDAGGMNVYLRELSRHLALLNIEVDIFTRAVSANQPKKISLFPGVNVAHIFDYSLLGLSKEELPLKMDTFFSKILHMVEGDFSNEYDLLHSHYWISGKIGNKISKNFHIPLVHNMHTMGKVKNLQILNSGEYEPESRILGEEDVARSAKRLIVNTSREAVDLENLYQVPKDRIDIIHPGVDLDFFSPGSKWVARENLNIDFDARVILFAGRLQRLKGLEVLLRAVALYVSRYPELRRDFKLIILGGDSGSKDFNIFSLINFLNIADVVDVRGPVNSVDLLEWYRAADLLAMPSYVESFGLVAVEAQAAGIPVLAADVGGLSVAVSNGYSGMLVLDHNIENWFHSIDKFFSSPEIIRRLSGNARSHASNFSWEKTAKTTIKSYIKAFMF